MKNLSLLLGFLLVFFTHQTFSQNGQIPRAHVFMEVFAGTECCNLPGVELAFDEIIANDDPVLILRHDFCYCSNGAFENEHAVSRSEYYEITGAPNAFFNGTENYAGGGDFSVYDEYEWYFEPMIGDLTSYDLEMTIEKIASASYVAHIIATQIDPGVVGQIFTLQLAATVPQIENNSIYSWFEYNRFVQLDMYPDHNGTPVDFSSQNQHIIDIPFATDSVMDGKILHMIAFLQDDTTKAIVQDVMVPCPVSEYNEEVALLNLTNIPLCICEPTLNPEIQIRNFGLEPLTSLNIKISTGDDILFDYDWTGNVSFTEKEVITIPEFSFNADPQNQIVATISNPNGLPDPVTDNNVATRPTGTQITTEMFVVMKLNIESDPDEVSWELINPEGEVIHFHDTYSSSGFYMDTLPFYDYGCHKFILHDSEGDGLHGNCRLTIWNNNTAQNCYLPENYFNINTCQLEVVELKPQADFMVDNNLVCQGDTVIFINTSAGDADSLVWYFEGGYPSVSTSFQPEVVYSDTGNFDVKLVLFNAPYSDELILENYIHVASIPEVSFEEIPDQCVNWPPLELNQGFPAGGTYSGAFVLDGYFYPEQAGEGFHEIFYTYENEFGCSAAASQMIYVDVCVDAKHISGDTKFMIYPNPVEKNKSLFFVPNSRGLTSVSLVGMDNAAVLVFHQQTQPGITYPINLEPYNLRAGIYLVSIETGTEKVYRKIIVY
jgi:hypothetical protein